MKTLLTFPSTSLKKNTTPAWDVNYTISINIKDLPRELNDWREINPRWVKNNIVYKAIKNSLNEDPTGFYNRDRWLSIIADTVTYNTDTKTVGVIFTDHDKHGLLDWGHTFEAIQDYLDEVTETEDDSINIYIKVQIMIWVPSIDITADIVESLNTSAQVKPESIINLREWFDIIKTSLERESYSDRIHYSEYERDQDGKVKDISITDIVSYLICFNISKYTDETQPVKAYSWGRSIFKEFESTSDALNWLTPLLKDILELYDLIYINYPNLYEGNFGNLTWVKSLSNWRNIILPFIWLESNYVIPKGFIYPILAAFRNLVIFDDNNNAKRLIKPTEMFGLLWPKLIKIVWTKALEHKNPNKLGKDKDVWTKCYDEVEKYLLKNRIY